MVEVAGVGTVDVQPFDPNADDDMQGHDTSNLQQDEVSERVPFVPASEVPNLPDEIPDLAPEPDPGDEPDLDEGEVPGNG